MIFSRTQKGFTIVELVVSVGIFAFMTAFLVARYGNFNQSVLLTNLAYDVALTIRNAQTYGLNVKSRPSGGLAYSTGTDGFDFGYGVYFTNAGSGNPPQSTQLIFFSDLNGNSLYDSGEAISNSTLRNGSRIHVMCTGTSESDCSSQARNNLSVVFKRPDPNASIRTGDGTKYNYAEITVQASGGSTKRVAVRSTGQITVLQ